VDCYFFSIHTLCNQQFILLDEVHSFFELHTIGMENLSLIAPQASTELLTWPHPTLALYEPEEQKLYEHSHSAPPKLYLVPTPHFYGEDDENQDQPQPSPLSELPVVEEWVNKLVFTILEIFSHKRSIAQLNRWCHYRAFMQLTTLHKLLSDKKVKNMKIRKFYISQPIEGVIESVITLRVEDRVRSMTIRCEGVDHRWMCTDIALL
jgi:hypothetical protein